ncbi:MAG: hypothetical protein WBG02_02490 [Candidatus Acidiferrum sp.]
MALVVLSLSTARKILVLAACVLACAWLQTPIASAQRISHVGGGEHFRTGARIGTPHIVAAPAPAPRAMFFRGGHGLSERSFLIFRGPFIDRAPFFNFGAAFDSYWWLYCGPIWGGEFGCNDLFLSSFPFEHYLAPPLTYGTPVYVYSLDGHPLAQLFLKDGTVYRVNDYWFLDGQIHFTMLDESGTKSVEQVIGFDELDVQKTIDVNSRRGFRVVMRNEPIEQYLRDYPDVTPPLLQPAQKN